MVTKKTLIQKSIIKFQPVEKTIVHKEVKKTAPLSIKLAKKVHTAQGKKKVLAK